MVSLEIKMNQAGQRLDKFLGKYLPQAPFSFLYKMLRKKNITLNGKRAEGKEILQLADQVTLWLADETILKFGGYLPEQGQTNGQVQIDEPHPSTVNKALNLCCGPGTGHFQQAYTYGSVKFSHCSVTDQFTESLAAGQGFSTQHQTTGIAVQAVAHRGFEQPQFLEAYGPRIQQITDHPLVETQVLSLCLLGQHSCGFVKNQYMGILIEHCDALQPLICLTVQHLLPARMSLANQFLTGLAGCIF